eukprot:jgi/Mesvir1/7125/Mv09227-RA.1
MGSNACWRVAGTLYIADLEYCNANVKFALHIDELVKLLELPEELFGGGSSSLEKKMVRSGSTNLGNLIADSMALVGNALSPQPVRLGVYNSGGIGTGAPRGLVDLGTIRRFFRFRNGFAVKALNGSEVVAMLRHSASEFGDGAFLQVSSNFHVVLVMTPEGRAELREALYRNEDGHLVPFDELATYNIAINEYMGRGGDDYDMFVDKPDLLDTDEFKAIQFAEIDALGVALIWTYPEIPISNEARYTILGDFLNAGATVGPLVTSFIDTFPAYKRTLLHALKEYSYAEGDPSFFNHDLSALTADDGKGQRFISAIDDAMGAAARVGELEGAVPTVIKAFMRATLQRMEGYIRIAMDAATAAGCDDDDDMHLATEKFLEGLARVLDRPEDVLDEWREAYRISTECVMRGPKIGRKMLRYMK